MRRNNAVRCRYIGKRGRCSRSDTFPVRLPIHNVSVRRHEHSVEYRCPMHRGIPLLVIDGRRAQALRERAASAVLCSFCYGQKPRIADEPQKRRNGKTMKNLCAKTRPLEDPYEVWVAGDWEWRVLKKWQVDDDKPYARWFCAVRSPMTYGSFEYGDTYVRDIKSVARRVDDVPGIGDYTQPYGERNALGTQQIETELSYHSDSGRFLTSEDIASYGD